jgi:hypothetical protein
MTATVVTAYYKLSRNKYTSRPPITTAPYDPKKPYVTWIKKLLRLKANMIFFTDTKTYETTLKPLFEESEKKNIVLQIVERSDFYVNKNFGVDWKEQYRIDYQREIHSAEVYDIWTQKVDFILRAMDLDVYKSNAYAWVDAGIFRGCHEYDYVFETFPSTRRLVPGKIMFNLQTDLRDEEKALRSIHEKGGFVPNLRRDVVSATFMLGDCHSWKRFHDIYYHTFKRYYDRGFFVGREETVFTKCLIIHPDLFHTYKNTYSSIKDVFLDIADKKHIYYFIPYFSEPATSSLSSAAVLPPGKEYTSLPEKA